MSKIEVWQNDLIIQEALDNAFAIPEINVVLATESRILIIGTNHEIWELARKYGFLDGTQRFGYCSKIYDFKEAFFGVVDLEEQEKFSLPKKLISTGSMRSYEYLAETVYVADRLKKFSSHFGVPTEEIEPFHL